MKCLGRGWKCFYVPDILELGWPSQADMVMVSWWHLSPLQEKFLSRVLFWSDISISKFGEEWEWKLKMKNFRCRNGSFSYPARITHQSPSTKFCFHHSASSSLSQQPHYHISSLRNFKLLVRYETSWILAHSDQVSESRFRRPLVLEVAATLSYKILKTSLMLLEIELIVSVDEPIFEYVASEFDNVSLWFWTMDILYDHGIVKGWVYE